MSRRIVITGASTGIGRAMALGAHRAGWQVLGTVRKDADAEALQADGLATARLDLAVPESLAEGARAIQQWCGGRLDALVHNAGSSWPGPVELAPMDEVRRQFEVNTFGHVDLTQRLLPAVRQARGRIVFVSSDSVTMAPPLLGAYAASKRAIEAFAEALAQEVADQGVSVVVLAPGPYRSAIWETSQPRGAALLEGQDPRLAHYRPLARLLQGAVARQPLNDPADLATVLLGILQTRNPRFRYVAPFRSRAQGWAKQVLGPRVFHRLLRRALARLAGPED